MQERGVLIPYYRALVADFRNDPTGYAALTAVLREKDTAAFQRRWEAAPLDLVR